MAASESSPEVADLDIAIAHWHVRSWGGAEYLVTRLAEALGRSEVYTLGVPTPEEPNPYGEVDFVNIRGDLDLPRLRRLIHLGGRAAEYSLWEDVDWRKYGDPDILITSGSTTRAVITPDDTLHVNYCHSPPRWLYDLYHDRKDSTIGVLGRTLLRRLRTRDFSVDPRVDYYFANSPIVARRLWKYYKREASILYPPVDLELYNNRGDEGYYLHLGRLDKEKGVSEVITAFEGLNERLILAGGRGDIDPEVLHRIEDTRNVDYRGFVDDEEKRRLLAACTAVIFNGVAEDLGIVPIEANASGKAVLSRDEGFPSVLITEGENGLLHDGSPKMIRQSVGSFQNREWSSGVIRSRAERFSIPKFREQLVDFLGDAYGRLLARGHDDSF